MCVPLMSRSLSNDYLFGSESAKALHGGCDKKRIRIDRVAGDVIDQVGFEKNVLAADVQGKQPQPGKKSFANVLGVVLDAKNRNPRARWPPDHLVLSPEEGKRDRSASRDSCGTNQKLSAIDRHSVTPNAGSVRS